MLEPEPAPVVGAAPTSLASFALGPCLARSAHTELLAARDAGGRRCLIKRLRPERAEDAGAAAQLREEVWLARRLDHPHLVRAWPAGDDALAVEWVDGPSLRALLEDLGDALPRAAALEIVRDVAAALAYLHGRADEAGQPLELVHRDVSLDTVRLGPAGALLGDLGRARFRGRSARAADAPTSHPAPEQRTGEGVDGRADVYALGCVLAALLGPRAHEPELAALLARMRAPVPYDRPDARSAHAELGALHAQAGGPTLREVLALRRALVAPRAPVEATRADAGPPPWDDAPTTDPRTAWTQEDWEETARAPALEERTAVDVFEDATDTAFDEATDAALEDATEDAPPPAFDDATAPLPRACDDPPPSPALREAIAAVRARADPRGVPTSAALRDVAPGTTARWRWVALALLAMAAALLALIRWA